MARNTTTKTVNAAAATGNNGPSQAMPKRDDNEQGGMNAIVKSFLQHTEGSKTKELEMVSFMVNEARATYSQTVLADIIRPVAKGGKGSQTAKQDRIFKMLSDSSSLVGDLLKEKEKLTDKAKKHGGDFNHNLLVQNNDRKLKSIYRMFMSASKLAWFLVKTNCENVTLNTKNASITATQWQEVEEKDTNGDTVVDKNNKPVMRNTEVEMKWSRKELDDAASKLYRHDPTMPKTGVASDKPAAGTITTAMLEKMNDKQIIGLTNTLATRYATVDVAKVEPDEINAIHKLTSSLLLHLLGNTDPAKITEGDILALIRDELKMPIAKTATRRSTGK